MGKIAIIDADLIGRKRHRFPNLACMKLSGYWKDQGTDVVLKTDFTDLAEFDQVFLSKVFTDTPVPDAVLALPNVQCGGTGFFYDKAPPLPMWWNTTDPITICMTTGWSGNSWQAVKRVSSSTTPTTPSAF